MAEERTSADDGHTEEDVAVRYDSVEVVQELSQDWWGPPQYDLFVVFCGAEDTSHTGKTSLVKRLLGMPFDRDEAPTFVYGYPAHTQKPQDGKEYACYSGFSNGEIEDEWRPKPNTHDFAVKLKNATATETHFIGGTRTRELSQCFEKPQGDGASPAEAVSPADCIIRLRDTCEYLYSNSYGSGRNVRHGELFRFKSSAKHAAVVVYDVNDANSLKAATDYIGFLRSRNGSPGLWSIVLCGNKTDCSSDHANDAVVESARSFAESTGLRACFVSAATGSDESIGAVLTEAIAGAVAAKHPLPRQPEPDSDGVSTKQKSKGKRRKDCAVS